MGGGEWIMRDVAWVAVLTVETESMGISSGSAGHHCWRHLRIHHIPGGRRAYTGLRVACGRSGTEIDEGEERSRELGKNAGK